MTTGRHPHCHTRSAAGPTTSCGTPLRGSRGPARCGPPGDTKTAVMDADRTDVDFDRYFVGDCRLRAGQLVDPVVRTYGIDPRSFCHNEFDRSRQSESAGDHTLWGQGEYVTALGAQPTAPFVHDHTGSRGTGMETPQYRRKLHLLGWFETDVVPDCRGPPRHFIG